MDGSVKGGPKAEVYLVWSQAAGPPGNSVSVYYVGTVDCNYAAGLARC